MINAAYRAPVFVIIILFSISCGKNEISDKEEKAWLETIQADTGSGLVKAIWEEKKIDEPLERFIYNENGQLIEKTTDEDERIEYDYYPDGRLSERRVYKIEGTSYKYVYKYDDQEETIEIQALQVVEWDKEYPEEVQYYHYNESRERLVCEVKIDQLTGYDSVGNEFYEHKLIFKAEFRMEDNTMLEMLEFSPQSTGEWVYAGSSTYEYDDKTNPLFQPDFPPLDRVIYQFGESNITGVTGGLQQLNYGYQYNDRGLPFKRSMEGEPAWYYQYY